MCLRDGRGRKRRGLSHIPVLMHRAIDSGWLPAHCPHFKERERMAAGEEAGWRKECISVCKGKRMGEGGGATLNSWEKVNKAVSVWLQSLLLSVIVSFFFSLSSSLMAALSSPSPPRPHLANICSPHLRSADPDLHPSVRPPSARKFGCNQTFNRQGSPAGLRVNQCTQMPTYKPAETHESKQDASEQKTFAQNTFCKPKKS